jgi:TolB-like protein
VGPLIAVVAAVLGASAPPPAGAAEKPRLIVLELSAGGGVEAEVAGALTEAVTQEVADRGFFQVLSSKEVQTLVGLERQKQLVGCSEADQCLTELAGALDARFILSGSIARLGGAYQLAVQTLDSRRAQPVGRATRLSADLTELRKAIPWMVAEATGTPLPPPPSRVLPYSLLGAGGLALIGGGLLGVNAIAHEDAVNRELQRGEDFATTLNTLESYRQESRAIATKRTVSLITLLAGAGLIAAGIALNPPDVSRSGGGVALWLTPDGASVAFTGALP